MCKITLIATVHKEYGICNSKELHKLIEPIAADVIFEELSPTGFAEIYGGINSDTLETNTIKSYIQEHPISHFPVDLEKTELIDKHLKNNILEMFEIFRQSYEYNILLAQHNILSQLVGFPYLNSNQYSELSERRISLEKIILKNINHEKWFLTYKRWRDIIELRENEMVKNIYNYCDRNKYTKAVFLIGAEHKKPIMDKILKFETQNRKKLNWNFNYFV
ncbi:hypothetical protein [Flavobacterium granuli]|uniref:Uncharacterized protein n=1 Tax=Flavobacterium granuli TaxID=280093 RepID=A0ABU1S448_9FLAO|nr:hypothetical protein [Flavobacterium granuli]MDR6845814.1 hypothetical protein [Flavobacterium granuli]